MTELNLQKKLRIILQNYRLDTLEIKKIVSVVIKGYEVNPKK